MRENRPYGSEGGGPQLNAASLPLSDRTDVPYGLARYNPCVRMYSSTARGVR